MSGATEEIRRGERFAFGQNWQKFLIGLDEPRIRRAEDSLRTLLARQRLDGLRFLDIGCRSGLFSLAARRLGAQVYSFDYDAQSVACAIELRRRFSPGDSDWVIDRGSILDPEYVSSLGQFDIVYAWGVLHHTGSMWQAMQRCADLVTRRGQLLIAIYNDQGYISDRWKRIKKPITKDRW